MNRREKFFKLADALTEDDESDPWTAEPWPKWFQKVVLRLARVFIPALKVADFKQNRERFEGYGLAFVARLIEGAGKVDTTEFPDQPVFVWLKSEFEMLATVEAEKVQKALSAAAILPTDLSGEVFAAYSDGLKRDIAGYGLKRLADSHTAQICLFLLFARPWIEAGKVTSVTMLFDQFMKIKEAFPGQKKFFSKHLRARPNLEAQFRNICSADGVKIRSRGRPRKIQPAHT